jgi:hypothetical protein
MSANISLGVGVHAQRLRLLNALRLGPVSCIYARDELDVFQPNTRITDLRRMGFFIKCVKQPCTDSRGNARVVGVWFLISEPVPQQQTLSL